MRRSRRSSKTLHTGGADTPIPDQPCRDPRTIHSIASLIRGKNKLLVLENPDTVEIYELGHSTAISNRTGKDGVYLPVLKKTSSLTSIKSALSQSCSYLYDKRRGSFSSIASQRTQSNPKTESFLRDQREARKSNVVITMAYLGQGHRGSSLGPTQDELKVLQQVNGGENICVFKGLVSPREQFQFVSQRHRGFPFSITLYINGIMVARLSSCCEYRYAPGFQQGRKSCFRLIWLAGGIPCYRCTSLRNKLSSCQQMSAANERFILPLEQNPPNNTKPEISDVGAIRSSLSPPLFIPVKPEKPPVRRLRKHIKEGGGGSTDSEGPAVIKETSKRNQRRGQSNLKSNKCNTAAKKMDEGQWGAEGTAEVSQQSKVADSCEDQASSVSQEQTMTRSVREQPPSQESRRVHDSKKDENALNGKEQRYPQSRLEDFYEECVEMSIKLEQSPNRHNWFKANMLERRRLQKRLSSCPRALESDVERSAESDMAPPCDGEPKAEEDATSQSAGKEEPVKEQDLQAQLDAMMQVLRTSDEVEQLVLRNTDLTDDLLLSVAGVLKSSPSEVTLLNLNLNLIGPYGAHILLDVLRAKPQVKGLHLFGNKLCDHGVLTLLNGIAEVQEQTAKMAAAIPQTQAAQHNATPQLPTGWSSFKVFALLELDIGGNGLSSNGVRLLASYIRHYSRLQYLGLAQTSSADLAAWKELFDSLKGNRSLIHIILDENNLGDPGVRLLAEVLKENRSLRQVDLDKNGISDLGGNDIMGALLCRLEFPLKHLGLEENNISVGLMSRIQEEVKCK